MVQRQASLEDLETVEERMEQKQRDKLRRSWDGGISWGNLWEFMGYHGDTIWELQEMDTWDINHMTCGIEPSENGIWWWLTSDFIGI